MYYEIVWDVQLICRQGMLPVSGKVSLRDAAYDKCGVELMTFWRATNLPERSACGVQSVQKVAIDVVDSRRSKRHALRRRRTGARGVTVPQRSTSARQRRGSRQAARVAAWGGVRVSARPAGVARRRLSSSNTIDWRSSSATTTYVCRRITSLTRVTIWSLIE